MENKTNDFNQQFQKFKEQCETEVKECEAKFMKLAAQNKMSLDDLKKAFDAAVASAVQNFVQATTQTIVTKVGGKPLYSTSITLIQSVEDDYPQEKPDKDDVYWTAHQNQVSDALKARNDLLKSIITTVGSTIGGVFGGGQKAA